MNKTILVTIVAVAMLGLIPNATAQDHVGLSGQCYNSDADQGGQDEARVYTNGDVELLEETQNDDDLTDGKGGAADAAILFGTESVKEGGQTGNACKRDDTNRFDYVEVSAKIGAIELQVCYNSGVVLGTCPHSPDGPGED